MYSVYVQTINGFNTGDGSETYLLYAPGLAETESVKKARGYALINPKFEREGNKAGSFNCIIPPTNPSYGKVDRGSVITVIQDNEEVFRGRVLYYQKDFWNRKSVYAEGMIAILGDTIISPQKFENKTTNQIFQEIITLHNNLKAPGKADGICGRFIVGTLPGVQVSGVTYEVESYTDTLSVLNDFIKTVTEHELGKMRTRSVNGLDYIDWVSFDYGDQKIEFAKNLVDMTDYVTAENIWTVLLPIGKENLTIESVHGSKVLEDADGIDAWGRIMHVETWSDIDTAQKLLEKAQAELSEQQVERNVSSLEMNAVDLHLLNVNTDRIDILKQYDVLSIPHGIEQRMECTKISIDLQNPARSKYVFGDKRDSLTDQVGGR